MTDGICIDPIEFASADGKTTAHGRHWHDPARDRPRAIVQLVHGMAEHIGRYDAFARHLVAQGFAVCGHDHIGHGESVTDKSRWGCLPMDTGKEVLVADVHALREGVAGSYPDDTPFFAFGHSLGSYVLRAYIARHGAGLAGAVICGTGTIAPGTSRMGNRLARIVAKLKGPDTRSPFIDGMGAGGYGKKLEDPRTPLDWLSYDQGNVDRYLADEACGFMFSVGAYAVVTDLTAEVCAPACAERIPKELALLYIAGDADPVGDCGKGVAAACQLARDAGVEDVEMKIYDHMRHEILNEAGRQEVYDDVVSWIERHL